MTLFLLLPGSWPHLMPQGQQGGLFSALDFPDSGGSSCTSGKRTHDLARKWVYRLRESVPSGLCPFLPRWQLGSGLWSRDKAVIDEREACGEGAGFSPQMRESLPSLGVWKHHQLSRMLLKWQHITVHSLLFLLSGKFQQFPNCSPMLVTA